MGNKVGQVDIWKIWMNRWTTYGRYDGQVDIWNNIEGLVDILKIWKNRWTHRRYKGQVDLWKIWKDGSI